MATASVAIYLENLTVQKKYKGIILAHRLFRSKKICKNITFRQEVILNHFFIPSFPREPKKANPPDTEKLQLWVEAHSENEQEIANEVAQSIHYISFKRFTSSLAIATKKFNDYLLSLPESQKNYLVFIQNNKTKSNPWVTKLAEKYLTFPPVIISDAINESYLKSSEKIQHIVYFDDAAYSGTHHLSLLEFFAEMADLNQYAELMNIKFHFVLPFISKRAFHLFKDYGVIVHAAEIIPAFEVKGTLFKGRTATYFDHKIPASGVSTIECIEDGRLINGKDSGIKFVAPVEPPYKKCK